MKQIEIKVFRTIKILGNIMINPLSLVCIKMNIKIIKISIFNKMLVKTLMKVY